MEQLASSRTEFSLRTGLGRWPSPVGRSGWWPRGPRWGRATARRSPSGRRASRERCAPERPALWRTGIDIINQFRKKMTKNSF
jgi:hypothetical protein